METILDRIIKIAEKEGMSLTALERQLDTGKGTLTKAVKNNSDLNSKWLEKIAENFPQYDPRWILSGELPMKRENPEIAAESKIEYIPKTRKTKSGLLNNQLIPLYNLEATAGMVTLFSDSSAASPIDFIKIPNLPKSDGAVYVTGDSMYPLLKSGDIVIYKIIGLDLDNIFYGEMYLISINIDGDELTTVKWIQKSDLGADHVKLVSQNQHHQSKDIHFSKITALALIKASVRINSMS